MTGRLLLAAWALGTCALVFAPAKAQAQSQPQPQPQPQAHSFTPEQLRSIDALGPWPPAAKPDPSNRVSGKPMAIELGRRLFGDTRLSPTGYVSCVNCHQPDRAFTDHKPRAHGLADLLRNTPTLLNLANQARYGWDGASDSLWMASIRPLLDAREFDSSPAFVATVFTRDPELAACYRKVFGAAPTASHQRTLVNVGKALAAYQETLMSGRTAFDAYRDALLKGDAQAAKAYPAAAQRGLQLFVGQGQCVACHGGANFSDNNFYRIFANQKNQTGQAASVDMGRHEGITRLQSNPLGLHGVHNDGAKTPQAVKKEAPQDALRHQFRTQSLRNISATAPYMHDGRFERLADALQHPLPVDAGHNAPKREPLSATQVQDLEAFLRTLSDSYGPNRPWPSVAQSACP